MASSTFTIYGDVNVAITVTEIDGTLSFRIDVLDDTGHIGDLNALFFDLADDTLTAGLTIRGNDVTGTVLKADGVTKVDSYTNMSGEVINEFGKFDGGVQFGTSGIGTDDIRSTTFTLSHVDQPLTLADISLQDFGVRLTSVGAEDGPRTDSLKLGATAPEMLPDDPAPSNDFFTVADTEGDNPPGVSDTDTDGFIFNVLSNDGPNGAPYTGAVTTVNGQPNIEYYVEGSDGGSLIIYADGTIDFSVYDNSGNDDFGGLSAGETATTSFTYGTDDGQEHELTFTVVGTGGDGHGGPIGNV